jgi:hypothetical protein
MFLLRALIYIWTSHVKPLEVLVKVGESMIFPWHTLTSFTDFYVQISFLQQTRPASYNFVIDIKVFVVL